MIRTNTLPHILKRTIAVFLISLGSYFLTGAGETQIAGADVKEKIDVVVIDAGHGGKDSGAVGKKSKEKDIALKIALKLGNYIEEKIPDVKVVYTRKTDVFIPLYERAAIANKNEADLFISIHVNANGNTAPSGASSHVLGLHRTEENFDVAVRENSVIMLEDDYETTYEGFDPKSWESYVVFSVMQDTYLKQSIEFATYVQDQIRERAKRKDRGVVQQGILVLAQTAMPGVLVETGFITNLNEEKYLNTNDGQEVIASAIYRAFKQYKTRIEGRSHFEVHKTEDTPHQSESEINRDESSFSLRFGVQIAALKNRVDPSPDRFNGVNDIVVIDQGRVFKYVVDANLSYHEALNRCGEVKSEFPGAFVVAIKEGAIIPLGDALKEINE